MSELKWPAMTEAEWLDPTCDEEEQRLYFLDELGLLKGRKLRLFGCACLREVWDELPFEELREAILTCERFADGVATVEELSAASRTAGDLYVGVGDIAADFSTQIIRDLCHLEPWFQMGEGPSSGVSAVVAELRSDDRTPWHVVQKQARQRFCHYFREVFGNPFRLVPLPSEWRTEIAVALANAIYADRAFDRMPILADALEEAGCDSLDVLNHCRSGGPHVRGCWVVDAVLGKQ
jgi:hypothetical protein